MGDIVIGAREKIMVAHSRYNSMYLEYMQFLGLTYLGR